MQPGLYRSDFTVACLRDLFEREIFVLEENQRLSLQRWECRNSLSDRVGSFSGKQVAQRVERGLGFLGGIVGSFGLALGNPQLLQREVAGDPEQIRPQRLLPGIEARTSKDRQEALLRDIFRGRRGAG